MSVSINQIGGLISRVITIRGGLLSNMKGQSTKYVSNILLSTLLLVVSGCAQQSTPDSGTIESVLVGDWTATRATDDGTLGGKLGSFAVSDFSYSLTITDYAPTEQNPHSQLSANLSAEPDFPDNPAGQSAKALYHESPTSPYENIAISSNMSVSEYGATGSAYSISPFQKEPVDGVKIQPDETDHDTIYVTWPSVQLCPLLNMTKMTFHRK